MRKHLLPTTLCVGLVVTLSALPAPKPVRRAVAVAQAEPAAPAEPPATVTTNYRMRDRRVARQLTR